VSKIPPKTLTEQFTDLSIRSVLDRKTKKTSSPVIHTETNPSVDANGSLGAVPHDNAPVQRDGAPVSGAPFLPAVAH
jgi:hypothetical protein